MKTIAASVFCFCILSSCHNRTVSDAQNAAILKELNQTLLNCNALIDQQNFAIIRILDQRIKNPRSEYVAQKWQPKAVIARDLGASTVTYIENIKMQLIKASTQPKDEGSVDKSNPDTNHNSFLTARVWKELYLQLVNFKRGILNIDSSINAQFKHDLPLDVDNDRGEESVNKWVAKYPEHATLPAIIALLTKLQSDVLNSEHVVLDFVERNSVVMDESYSTFNVLTGSNSQYFKPGQQLIITAGIGAFTVSAKPVITIDGTVVPLNAEGLMEYKTRVGVPGTYTKDVKITYTTQDGATETIVKKIKYEVGSCGGLPLNN